MLAGAFFWDNVRKGCILMTFLLNYFKDCLVWLLGFSLVSNCYDIEMVTRAEWVANPPKLTEPMTNPVPYVIIHHSFMPPACSSKETCIEAMRWMQQLHQDKNGWNDIGYSFAIGGDGRVYVGRGWSNVGAHAPQYNDKSIGICLIGDWRYELPPPNQLCSAKKLIELGIKMGKISPNYTLYGHRQVREGTECPGDRLFKEITTWDHFSWSVQLKVLRNKLYER